jgi:thiamine biosynthesis lipoprotein
VRVEFTGATMGTAYSVVYVDADDAQQGFIEAAMRVLFDGLDRELSNWNSDSWVSRFNRNESLDAVEVPAHTAAVLELALEIAVQSGGALDPTVSPLIELWGFGAAQDWSGPPLAFEIEQALEVCGYTRLEFDPEQRLLCKHVPELQLNLSAVAKGYAVDQVAAVLAGQGIEDYLINIGGEVRASGLRPDGRAWAVRLTLPGMEAAEAGSSVVLRNASIATSGFSQRFFVWKGQRYAHLIDPRSGQPVSNALRSVSVRAEDCAVADGWATACCVLGLEAGMALIESLDDVDAVFYLENEAGEFVERVSSGWLGQ